MKPHASFQAVSLSNTAPQQAGPSRAETNALARPSSTITTLAVAAIVVAALYVARDIFVPLALAILLSFALSPLVWLLHRFHLGRIHWLPAPEPGLQGGATTPSCA